MSPRPQPQPDVRPDARPSVQPANDQPTPITTRPDATRPTPTQTRRSLSTQNGRKGVRKAGRPDGFELDRAQDSLARRMGGMTGTGGMMEGHPDESGGHHDDHHDDGHHGDHHDDHHDDWHIDIDINYWSHPTYCPSGWWYYWGDFDHDGHADYVCTNGSYSYYWYGWSGAFWDCSPWYGWYPTRYRTTWWSYSIPDTYRGRVYGIDEELADVPNVALVDEHEIEPTPVPLSAVEVARLEMSMGDPSVAIEAYRAHLSSYPEDWYALRELGVALLRDGQRGDGIAMIGYAHSQDPLLAYDVIPLELFGSDSREVRQVLVRAVGWAHRNPSASAWLTVATLMQCEGRDGPALRMVERAEAHGLDITVADQMRSALVQR